MRERNNLIDEFFFVNSFAVIYHFFFVFRIFFKIDIFSFRRGIFFLQMINLIIKEIHQRIQILTV